MLEKYRHTTRLGKVFIWLSIAIVLGIIGVYIQQVLSALAMDPNSYNCTSDSMMKQICHDPYGSSVGWTLILVCMIGWPILFIWAIIGVILIARRNKVRSNKKENNVKL